jgi:hypothetical protein
MRSLITRPPVVGTSFRGRSSMMVLIPGWGSSVGGFLNTHALFEIKSAISDVFIASKKAYKVSIINVQLGLAKQLTKLKRFKSLFV